MLTETNKWEILQCSPQRRACRMIDPIVYFDVDGSDLIRALTDPSRLLFELKFEPSITEMDGWIATL